jgi:hypothetical protein
MTSVSINQFAQNDRPVAASGMHSVRLERMPENLRFPEQLSDRIWFDGQQRRLVFRGFMSMAAFDRLHELSNECGYQRAIEELFRQCVYDESAAQSRPLRGFLPIVVLVVLTLLAIALAMQLWLFA